MAYVGSSTFRSLQCLKLKLYSSIFWEINFVLDPDSEIYEIAQIFLLMVKDWFSINCFFKLLNKTAFLKIRQSNYYLYLHLSYDTDLAFYNHRLFIGYLYTSSSKLKQIWIHIFKMTVVCAKYFKATYSALNHYWMSSDSYLHHVSQFTSVVQDSSESAAIKNIPPFPSIIYKAKLSCCIST